MKMRYYNRKIFGLEGGSVPEVYLKVEMGDLYVDFKLDYNHLGLINTGLYIVFYTTTSQDVPYYYRLEDNCIGTIDYIGTSSFLGFSLTDGGEIITDETIITDAAIYTWNVSEWEDHIGS